MPKTSFTIKREGLIVIMERIFDAPRELVWKTIIDPQIVPKWWGPVKFETIVKKMDFKVGGEWNFVHKGGGEEYSFRGVYTKIEPPRLVSQTFNFEPVGLGHEMTETMIFEELSNGKTKGIRTSVFQNIEDLEAMIANGMESGATETWERLAELVGKK